MKVRVVEDGGKFYVQYRKWGKWNGFVERNPDWMAGDGASEFRMVIKESLESAINWLNRQSDTPKSSKVVYEATHK